MKNALKQTVMMLKMVTPMLLAVIGLVGIFKTYVTPEMIKALFNGSTLHDMIVGTGVGAVSVGQPFVSYIIGGELLKEGASFYGVTAFILSFVTLGVVQLPMEFGIFGVRFTIWRNLLSLIFAFIVAFLTAYSVELLG